jgi:alkylation response protein AidB-like acyl-CoA dehydrogenase
MDLGAAFRRWIEDHLPSQWRDAGMSGDDEAQHVRIRSEWGRMLAEGGWVGPGIPTAYGGLGLSVDEQLAYITALVESGAPEQMNTNGLGIFAPSLLRFGTEEQKRRLLPAMLRHDEIWCQGFSEPEAGSDLRSLRTSAEREGDGFRLNGQKVWTSYAHHADWCYLLARVPGDGGGITMCVIAMDSPGVTVRPLRTMVGNSEFCEVFLDDVRVPAHDVIGAVGDGWRLAAYSLARERSSALAQRSLLLGRELERLLATVAGGTAGSTVPDEHLVDAFVSARALTATVRRTLAVIAGGGEPGMLSSIAKVTWSEAHQEQLQLAVRALGPAAAAGVEVERGWTRAALAARGETIYGGTSEVQRNLLAKALGLPTDR